MVSVGRKPGAGWNQRCEGIVDLDHEATRLSSPHRALEPINAAGELCVAILLSTFNGEQYLGEQLDSYTAQTHNN